MTHTEYERYLESDTWKQKRAERLKIDKGLCQCCLSEPATETHHLNYYSVGNEDVLKDLVSVCHGCHCKIHNLMTRCTGINDDGTYRYGWRDSLPGIVTRDLSDRGLM